MTAAFQIHPNLHSIASSFKAILLDAYGVFWGGNGIGVLPGAKQTMERLVKEGKIVGILSNSSQLAANEIEKLKKHGLLEGEHFHFFITSGEIVRNIFQLEKLPFETLKKRYWLWGGRHPKYASHHTLFEGSPYLETPNIEDADFIHISIPHIQGEDLTDPGVFRESVEKIIESKLPMLCVNPDHFAHEGNPPRAVVRQGSIAAIYEQLGGSVYYIGKPSSIAFSEAMQEFQKRSITDPQDVLMVGDTPETDIRGAVEFGMASALITQTGMMAERIHQHGQEMLFQLPLSDIPNFYIEQMADHGL